MRNSNVNKYVQILFVMLLVTSTIWSTLISSSSIIDHQDSNQYGQVIMPEVTMVDHRLILYKKPCSKQPEDGYPIIFLLHGAAQYPFSWFFPLNKWNKEQCMFTKSLLDVGFFIIAPSSGRPMRPGPHAWSSYINNISDSKDLQLFNSLFKWLENRSNELDLEQIYSCGFSSGAFMTSRLAKVYPERFEKVIIHSGTDASSISFTRFGPDFDCESPIHYEIDHPPVLMIHGKQDQIVPFECGLHMYNELQRNNIESTFLIDEQIGHIWISDFNDDIIDWICS